MEGYRVLGFVVASFFLSFASSVRDVDLISINITKLSIPPHVVLHNDVEFTCEYESKNPLFKIEWQFYEQEFYRYSPAQAKSEPIDTPETAGRFKVNLDESTATKLILNDVQLNATGVYNCRLVGNFPHMHEVIEGSKMEVMVLPEGDPRITGIPIKESSVGSDIQLKCTSAPSFPASELTWFIDGKKAPENKLTVYPDEKTEEGLLIRSLGLHFTFLESHLKNGEVTFKCDAQIKQSWKEPLYSRFDIHKHSHTAGNSTNSACRRSAGFLLLLIVVAFR